MVLGVKSLPRPTSHVVVVSGAVAVHGLDELSTCSTSATVATASSRGNRM